MGWLQAGPIVSAFTSLENVHTRREVIQSILSNLNRNEIRELRNWSLEQDFRRDIVGTLPIELAVQVLQEVGLRTAFICRRVSKKWSKILSSRCVVQALLRQWLSPGDPALHVPQGIPSSEAFSIIAEQIDAFRTGRPFSELTVFCNAGQDGTAWHSFLAYSTGFLAWYDISSRKIFVLELRSGVSKTWVNQNRENPYALALSENLLAVSTFSGRVFIYNHLTGDEYCIRLSSGYQRMLLLRGGTLAILHGSHVTTWTLATQKSYDFRVDPEDSPQSFANGIYITTSHEEIIYYKIYYKICSSYHRVWDDPSMGATVSFSRRSLNGALHFEDLRFDMPEEPFDISNIPIAVSKNCDFRKKIDVLEYGELRNSAEFRIACGHLPSGSYTRGLIWKDFLYEGAVELVDADVMAHWYDVMLAGKDLRDDQAQDGMHEVPSGKLTPAAVNKIGLCLRNGTRPASYLLGDDTFLVHALNDRFVVYCFAKAVNMSYGGLESKRLRP
ncbi:hypothetical protein MMC30_000773 [Trapelia coarctata]|nr:hypothetical protein [Trapelia coarctata]